MTKEQLDQLRVEIVTLELKLEAAFQTINDTKKQIRELRESCTHGGGTVLQSDASGNDSWLACSICGMEFE